MISLTEQGDHLIEPIILLNVVHGNSVENNFEIFFAVVMNDALITRSYSLKNGIA